MNESDNIHLKEIPFSHCYRLLDPNGRVFTYRGHVYRAIYPDRVEFVRSLFDRGVVDRLVDRKLLIGTRPCDVEVEGFGLVLEHDKIDVLTYADDWSLVTYIEAAKTFIDLLTELLRNGLMLVDGHPSNVSMAPGGRTLWHDFGSIVKARDGVPRAIEEFLETFYFPLQLYKRTGEFEILHRMRMKCSSDDWLRIAHPRLANLIRKTAVQRTHSTLARVVNKACRVAVYGSIHSNSLTQSVIESLGGFVHGSTPREPDVLRLLERLRDQISRIPIEMVESSRVENCDENGLLHPGDGLDSRHKKALALVEKLGPDRVLVIESEECGFSIAASRHHNCVISVDPNAGRVSQKALRIQDRNSDDRIYPIIADVIGDERAVDLRSHTVVALSLTHQLRLQQGYAWPAIAERLARLSEKYLITDFMVNGVGQMKVSPSLLPIDYRLETFLDALGNHFHDVKVISCLMGEGETPRAIVLCEK